MKKLEKTFFVDNLKEELKSASSVVLVDYTGLSVKKQQELKKILKAVNARMFVAKNSLFKIAGQGANIPEETLTDSVLSGPTAYIITESDPIAPIQALAKFATSNEILQFKVAVIDGKFQDKETLTALSKLPSREVLYSQVVGSVSAPMYGIISTLQANTQKLIYVLKSKIASS